jgi:hypothetical protein
MSVAAQKTVVAGINHLAIVAALINDWRSSGFSRHNFSSELFLRSFRDRGSCPVRGRGANSSPAHFTLEQAVAFALERFMLTVMSVSFAGLGR